MDNFEALPQLIGVVLVVDFKADVPGGNWVTVRFPPGPSSVVHLGGLEWRVKCWRNRVKPSKKTMEKQREWKDKINRTDWGSGRGV
jgi:hypothetical protein